PSGLAGGPAIKVAPVDGGAPVVVATSTSGCQPVWSSPTTLWYSRRTGASYQWLEVDIAKNQPTGKTRTARGPCLAQTPDPDPPVAGDVRAVITEDWDVRVHQLQ